MELPVCEICAYTNELCKKCKDRYRSGEITKIDIQLSKLLYSLAKHKDIEKLVVKGTVKVGDLVLILTDSNPGLLIGKGGKTIKYISKELGYNVRVINNSGSEKDKICDLLWPIPVLGLNEVYSTEGTYTKVRVPVGYSHRLPFELKTLEEGAGKLLKKQVRIVFE